MKKFVVMLGALALAVGVSAVPIDITVDDGLPKGDFGPEYTGGEDGAVNFGSNWGQEWDLESFVFDPATNMLTVKSGFNVFTRHSENVMLGDIFVDLSNNGSWDYAVVFNRDVTLSDGDEAYVFDNTNYSIVQITDASRFVDLQGNYNNGTHVAAKPYAYVPVASEIISTGTFTQTPDDDSYVISGINLGEIPYFDGTNFKVHLTMSCGNDAMVGQVAEPGMLTLLVLGLSTLGCAFIRRKK